MRERVFKNTSRYVTEFDFDLAGRSFDLVMDNGREYVANFLSGEIVMWAEKGQPFGWEKYQCLKADDSTFFVNMELFGQPLRTCRTLVLDLANSLVTLHLAVQGGIPYRPRMVETTIVFGAIRQPGRDLPFVRHGYTADLVGKKVTWTYSSGFINTHIYTSETCYRIRPLFQPPAAVPPTPAELERKQAEEEKWKGFFYEEPAHFVRIKEGIYLCSFIEENMNKKDNSTGGNNLLLLANLKEGFDVGRTFSWNANQQPEGGMFSSFCEPTDEDIENEHWTSPYRT
jgi:hypothetical protein